MTYLGIQEDEVESVFYSPFQLPRVTVAVMNDFLCPIQVHFIMGKKAFFAFNLWASFICQCLLV